MFDLHDEITIYNYPVNIVYFTSKTIVFERLVNAELIN